MRSALDWIPKTHVVRLVRQINPANNRSNHTRHHSSSKEVQRGLAGENETEIYKVFRTPSSYLHTTPRWHWLNCTHSYRVAVQFILPPASQWKPGTAALSLVGNRPQPESRPSRAINSWLVRAAWRPVLLANLPVLITALHQNAIKCIGGAVLKWSSPTAVDRGYTILQTGVVFLQVFLFQKETGDWQAPVNLEKKKAIQNNRIKQPNMLPDSKWVWLI